MDGIAAPLQQSSPVGEIPSANAVWERFLQKVPIAYARRFNVVAFTPQKEVMSVAMASFDHLHVLDKLSVLLGLPAEPILVPEDMIRALINQAYGAQESGVEETLDGLRHGSRVEILDDLTGRSVDLLDNATTAPVTKLVNTILLDAVKRRASDIHLQAFEDRLQVRLRIDGVLYDTVQPPRHLQDEMVSRIKVMARMNIAEKRLSQDGRTTVRVGDKVIDLRISSLPTCHGERMVLRLLDKSARLYRLTELGMSPRDLKVFGQLIRQTHGIILVTGPTGSGKSTTLYAALQELNCKELNIITLEDPIEYQLRGISQTQVSDKKGMTFATGLRAVLRQDPDVIMVGEIRDEATARMAIQSSLTGHLVFSTLHTNDAAGAVARLLDLGTEPYLVAGSVLAVLAQRLVRQVCVECRRRRELTQDDALVLGLTQESIGQRVYDAQGCERCHKTGYFDRIGIFELLRMDEEMHDLIVSGARRSALHKAAIRCGMTTLRDHAVGKLLAGQTTLEEVVRVTPTHTHHARLPIQR